MTAEAGGRSEPAPPVGTDRTAEPDDATVLRLFAGQPVDQDTIAHYRGLLQRRLLLNRCNDCSEWHHPPRPLCPRCWSFDVSPTEVSGSGTIVLLTFLDRGEQQAPHPVATVDLDEQRGLRFTATIRGQATPDTARVGDRVQLVWIATGSGSVPAFAPEGTP
jgi:uncharacterized OB-fold protein